jgi:MFS transporter, OFA family, oxalate/formate antiporter
MVFNFVSSGKRGIWMSIICFGCKGFYQEDGNDLRKLLQCGCSFHFPQNKEKSMAQAPSSGEPLIVNHGWRVTCAGVGINLALGILYTWSVFKENVPADWGWDNTDKTWPYAVACLVFALMMVPAGRLQDKIGPRTVATFGGLLVGAGMVFASMFTSVWGYVIGFGLLAGMGIGCGYASATPPAVKWFPAARTGMIAGLVVSGFGLASVYTAPLSRWLIDTYEFNNAFFILGIGFMVVVVVLAQLLAAPPKGYVPAGTAKPAAGAAAKKEDFTPKEMLSTVQFYLLWFMYFCGAGAGLMVISSLANIANKQAGIDLGYVLVASMAIGNGGGRILAGTVSDKIGCLRTMFICFIVQAVMMVLLSMARVDSGLDNMTVMAIISALIGANYGANLALFPAITKDYYGLKNFGVNYGFVFTAWGIGGFLLSVLLAGTLTTAYGNYYYACYIAAGLLVLAAGVTFTVKRPHAAHGA